MIGRTLAHYEITDHLGTGGMGEVYRARDARLGREVAIKMLPAAVATDAGLLARFEQEARTVASLNHPSIVTLFSVEESEGVRFLTMELVQGEGLDRSVRSGGLDLDRVVHLGIALAEALAAAHEKGIVHRDLKPANVMLTGDGHVKVLDFGIAKLEQDASGIDPSDAATAAAPASRAGQLVGTVPYMAPEQVRGGEVDRRTDIFALGILLYELATGLRPFLGDSLGEVSAAILRDTPAPLSRTRADVPADLERILARCLEKEPRARYQTAVDLANDLRSVGKGQAGVAFLVAPPTPSTPLLGREEHLVQAATRVQEGARLLTVSGYGGTGKTRFSIELFHRLAPDFEGGAAFVSLASVTDSNDVLPTVSKALDIAEAHGRSALEALCTVIGERAVLLVMDNLEQVLDAAADIAILVSRCPRLQVITTSRAPLKVGAEAEFSLPPLALPDEGDLSTDHLLACASVALFVQRAARVKPDFVLDETNAQAVSEICRHLDGLPLALELAAARVRILDPTRLLQRLDHALDLLTSGDRDLPLRQRTLRATISWSYSLLEPSEQRLLRACSVFHEGWTFEAMEQVCYDEEHRWRALDELESLVEKGLVRVVGSGERYALLETIRAFSAEQLHAGGEVDAMRNAHADFFVEFTAEMGREFRDVGQVPANRRVRADHANELAAIHWLLVAARVGDHEALEKALLVAGHLVWFWHVGGQHNTARGIYDELLALAARRPPSRGRALSWIGAGMVSITTGEWDRALKEWTAGYSNAITIGDRGYAAEGCMGAGFVHLSCGRLEEARPLLDEAISLSRGGVNEFMFSLSMVAKGMLLFQSGDLDDGVRLVEEGLAIQKRRKDCEGGGIALSFLAQMKFAKGDLERAKELYRESYATFEEVGDRPEMARVLCETGWTELADEDPAAAKRSFVRAVLAYEEVGSPRGTGLAMLGLAAVEAALGNSERAVVISEAANALAARAGVVCDHPMDPGVAERIEGLKVGIAEAEVGGIVERGSGLSVAGVLGMVGEVG